MRAFNAVFALVAVLAFASGLRADERAEVVARDELSAVEAVEDAADHSDGHHGDGHHGDGHDGGAAEVLTPKIPTTIASLVSFLLFLGLLTKFAWKPLMEGLSKREENIRGAMVEAQSARDEARALLAEHSKKLEAADAEVKEIIAEARRDAEHTASEITARANADAEATKNRAIAEIERAKDAAIVELAARERDLIADATETVLGRAITDDDRSRLIDEAVSQFSQRA